MSGKGERVERSSGGKFVCECKREYESVQTLRKHQKECFARNLMNMSEDDSDEGTVSRTQP
jgi:hypothetical protein